MCGPRKYPFRIYFWKIRDPLTGKLRKTRWRMSEEEAARYPGAIKVEDGSLEIKRPSEPHGTPKS